MFKLSHDSLSCDNLVQFSDNRILFFFIKFRNYSFQCMCFQTVDGELSQHIPFQMSAVMHFISLHLLQICA